MTTTEIRNLISKAKTERAIKELKKLAPKYEKTDEINILSARYSELKKEEMLGIIDNSTKNMEQNKINASLLKLLEEIEEEIKEEENNRTEPKVEPNKNELSSSENEDEIKILFINSQPRNKTTLDIGHEIRNLKNALDTSIRDTNKKFNLIIEEALQTDLFFRLINRYKPDFIHISMHASKKKGLLFEDLNGLEEAVTNEDMIDFFNLYTKKHKKPECLIINACQSAEMAKSLTPFFDYTIGNQDFIPDSAALIFTKHFYEILFDGEDIEYSYEFACNALKREKIEAEGEIPVHEIPVLYKKE